MKDLARGEQEQIVWKEMRALVKQGYINEKEYRRFMVAYEQYQKDKSESLITKEAISKPVHQQTKQQSKTEVLKQTEKAVKQSKPQPKTQTPEQARERNITWGLILGVIFLLIGGLVAATSTWELMSPLLKVFTLFGVSLFFFGLSVVSSKLLKIEKTAFAFLTLGSLLIPITVIAIGFFELFGTYLSLTGEGRYLLGIIGTLLPLPLYMRIGHKHQSKLFVWITYIFLSLLVGFLVASTKVNIDVFYLLIMVYNGLMLFGYHRFKAKKILDLFIKELPRFAQLNLVLSTLLMLFVFEQELFYSFNILLTAALYMGMVFTYNTKEYQFVFSALFAYGTYQLTENSWLVEIDLVIFAIIGALYLVFAKLVRSETFLSKMFHYTSAVISFCAFIYISYQGLVLRADEGSIVLLAAYLVITFTYIYLAEITKNQLFQWLAAIFLLYATGLQLTDIVTDAVDVLSPQLFMFFFNGLGFLLIATGKARKYTKNIQVSVYYLSLAAIFFSMLYGFLEEAFLEVCLMLLLAGFLALYVIKTRSKTEQQVATWLNPITWFMALFILYPWSMDKLPNYQITFGIAFHLAITGLILLGISVLWRKLKRNYLDNATFYTGQVSYLLGLLQLLDGYNVQINEDFLRPLTLVIGIIVFVWLVRRTAYSLFWGLVSLTSLAFYISLISSFQLESFEAIVIYLLFAPVLLLAVERLGGKRNPNLKPYFFWLAHIIQPVFILLLLLDQIGQSSINPVLLFIPLLLYIYSSVWKQKEWEKKLLLYGGMTVVALITATHMAYYEILNRIPGVYGWFITSIFFLVAWLFVTDTWKKRLEWYIIPFVNYGLWMFVTIKETVLLMEIIPVFLFVVISLFFWHRRSWTFGIIIPLSVTFLFWELQRYLLEDYFLILISVISFVVLTAIGRLLFKSPYNFNQKVIQLDWYSITAVGYLVYMLSFMDHETNVWIEALPTLMFTVWLLVQKNRLKRSIVRKTITTVAIISVLPAYFLIYGEYEGYLPELFHAEVIALPFLLIPIILSRKTWKGYSQVMTHVQTASLLLVTIYLVIDAIQGHTIGDALLIGSLSLLSVLVGMQLRIKSYFFIGVGTLLFNLIYQTKPYWGNMPWWGYLLIAGLLLIGLASYNEWRKQKSEIKLEKKLKRILSKLREWS
ncbi:SCO7613 C-terminal domain-containing membrane protein [Aquibacillus kalidii]|uniref:SCO7613 C-terminal domain-containing membrane protein n=1 Tax=Aquibacillus kalidii TaxID=2762597 RepID=UPI001648FF1C|nr:hypothetical protein [Aquibacillus kalidii]